MLPVGDGNEVYWECSGSPQGQPVVYFHGGPGSGATAGARRFFDPEKYRIVVFDQRGCGRSRPLVSKKDDLRFNTTPNLISDVETLRGHLGIDTWTVLGVSWGTTLALAYAQAHPDRVSAIVLACVTTTSKREVKWITEDVGCLFPRQWEAFARHVPERLKHLPLVDAYAMLLFEENPKVCEEAAVAWCAWEDSHVSLTPGHEPNKRFLDPEYRLRFARLVTHYWRHAAFLEDNQLLENAGRLNGIPGVLLHGAYDVSSPSETAWQLHQRWPGSSLQIVADAGHGSGSMPELVTAALDRLVASRTMTRSR